MDWQSPQTSYVQESISHSQATFYQIFGNPYEEVIDSSLHWRRKVNFLSLSFVEQFFSLSSIRSVMVNLHSQTLFDSRSKASIGCQKYSSILICKASSKYIRINWILCTNSCRRKWDLKLIFFLCFVTSCTFLHWKIVLLACIY